MVARFMVRWQKVALSLMTLLASWYLMQCMHELGHAAAAWITGGQVTNIVLHPLEISRTDVHPNPRPLFVVWAGPIVGITLPVFIWLVSRGFRFKRLPAVGNLVQFFAGFCLIANGAYIAFGSFERIGDCGQMLRHGSPHWLLWLFGAATIPAGLWLWHRLGRKLR